MTLEFLFKKYTLFTGEIHKAGSKLIVAKGGLGGCQETGYSGQKGERRFLYLDLKLIADIALVGFPNAGKSTMLNAISNANPRIASYPCKYYFINNIKTIFSNILFIINKEKNISLS